MTVEFFGIRGFGPPVSGVRKTERNDASQKTGKTESGDQVAFSSLLEGVNKSQAATQTADTERSELVQNLKQEVADGTYSPDLDKVAASLLKFLVEGR
ncbi:MAG: flagellar biosynthesis anti-sigma factor FlgM [Desulfobulbaceae bacterium A2]|nr:MAG: flagellar biosynthesis anti-sigma factor FlgM [Desulfobulbaceae bacterium A2]